MNQVTKKSLIFRSFSVTFIVTILTIALLFTATAFNRARQKDFWTDEIHGLKETVGQAYSSLLLYGANVQGSPAPLDYIALRFLDKMSKPLNYLGLPYNIYYRLNSILFILLSGIVVMFYLFLRIRSEAKNYLLFGIQLILLIAAISKYYYFQKNIFPYSVEARPYALWTSLWFTIMALFLYQKRFTLPLIFLLILLAATATASIYQLFCFAVSFVIVDLLNQKKPLGTIKTVFKIFGIPIFVALYYTFIIRNVYFSFVESSNLEKYLQEFFAFWKNKEWVPILSFLGIIMTMRFKELQSHTVIFLTMFLLYLISPLINYITLSRGFFFSSRQYLYYELIYSIFLIHLALTIPYYLKKIKKIIQGNNCLEIND